MHIKCKNSSCHTNKTNSKLYTLIQNLTNQVVAKSDFKNKFLYQSAVYGKLSIRV